MIRFLLFLLLITSFSLLSRADYTSTDQEDRPPKLITEKDQPYRLVWKDGRVAKIMSQTEDPITSSVDFTHTKNTCVNVKAPTCHIRTKFQEKKIMYIWEKNPVSPDRVGKILIDEIRGAYSNRSKMIDSYLITQYGQVLFRELGFKSVGSSNLKDIIVCDHFNWLPKADKNKIVVQSWLSEFDQIVPDFAIQGVENSTFTSQYTSGAKSIYLSQISPTEVEVDDMELFDTGSNLLPTMTFGFTTEFSFDVSQYDNHPNKIPSDKNYPNPTCKVQFAMNFNALIESFEQYGETRTESYDLSKAVDVLVDLDPHQYLLWLDFNISGGGIK